MVADAAGGGVGLTLAVVIALEVGDVARFATAEKLAGDAGTPPRVHASGGRLASGRLARTSTAM
jgi:transposase